MFYSRCHSQYSHSESVGACSLIVALTAFPHYSNEVLRCNSWGTWTTYAVTLQNAQAVSSRLPMLKVLLVLGLQLSAAEVSRANSSTTPTSRPLIIVLGMSMSGTESPNPDPDPQPLTLSLTRMPKSGTEP